MLSLVTRELSHFSIQHPYLLIVHWLAKPPWNLILWVVPLCNLGVVCPSLVLTAVRGTDWKLNLVSRVHCRIKSRLRTLNRQTRLPRKRYSRPDSRSQHDRSPRPNWRVTRYKRWAHRPIIVRWAIEKNALSGVNMAYMNGRDDLHLE